MISQVTNPSRLLPAVNEAISNAGVAGRIVDAIASRILGQEGVAKACHPGQFGVTPFWWTVKG